MGEAERYIKLELVEAEALNRFPQGTFLHKHSRFSLSTPYPQMSLSISRRATRPHPMAPQMISERRLRRFSLTSSTRVDDGVPDASAPSVSSDDSTTRAGTVYSASDSDEAMDVVEEPGTVSSSMFYLLTPN